MVLRDHGSGVLGVTSDRAPTWTDKVALSLSPSVFPPCACPVLFPLLPFLAAPGMLSSRVAAALIAPTYNALFRHRIFSLVH